MDSLPYSWLTREEVIAKLVAAETRLVTLERVAEAASPNRNDWETVSRLMRTEGWYAAANQIDALAAAVDEAEKLMKGTQQMTGPAPRYCPWCGSSVEEYGHDDDCDQPGEIESVLVRFGSGDREAFIPYASSEK